MKIHHLKPATGAHKAKTRKGRGEAAGKPDFSSDRGNRDDRSG